MAESTTGLTKATPTEEFNGQSYIIVFNEVPDYKAATVDSITADGFDVGQVFEGSTSWNGEDPSLEDILDEQGDVIVSTPKKGTYGFDFEMADFSAEKFKTFLLGKDITVTKTASNILAAGSTAVKVGSGIPMITRPVALVNNTSKKAVFFPKANIVTGPAMEDKLFVLKAICKAQDIDTENLGTFMLLDKLALAFKA